MSNPFARPGTAVAPPAQPVAAPPAQPAYQPPVQHAAPVASPQPPAAPVSAVKAQPDGFAAAGMDADPFALPQGPGSGEKITDFLGELVLVRPHELVVGIQTKRGPADAIRADVVVLTGDQQGHKAENILIFQIALKRDLTRILEDGHKWLLGRLEMGQEKPGKNAPYVFNRPTEADAVLARQWMAVNK